MKIISEENKESKSINKQTKKENHAPNKGLQKYLRGGKNNLPRYNFLCYNYVGQSDNLDRAFNMLFEEILMTEESHDDKNN